MTEIQPPQQPVTKRKSVAPVVLRILLAILLFLPGLAGLVALGIAVVWWSFSGYDFDVYEGGWVMIPIVIGIGCVLFSVVSIGIVLRFARWKKAPIASLVLAIIAVLSIGLAQSLTLDALMLIETKDRFELIALSGLAIVLGPLPPFLHWWKSR